MIIHTHIKIIHRKLLLIVLWLVVSNIHAQQQPIYTQYMFNMLAINPAYAGSHEALGATALFRKQWVGIPGAPQTTTLGVEAPANNDWIGLGLQLFNDQIGVEKTTGIVTSYAFRMHVTSEEDELAMGVQFGASNFSADYTKVDLIYMNDPSFAGNVVNVWLPSFGAGFYYHNDHFYAGLSAPNLLTSALKNKSVVTQSAVSAIQTTHFFFTTGYVIDLNEDLKLKPSVLVKAVAGAPIQTDINANLWINDIISVGASYQTGSAVSGMLEVMLTPQLRIGYAYDRSINGLGVFNQGSHEVMLRLELKNNDKVSHPRYF